MSTFRFFKDRITFMSIYPVALLLTAPVKNVSELKADRLHPRDYPHMPHWLQTRSKVKRFDTGPNSTVWVKIHIFVMAIRICNVVCNDITIMWEINPTVFLGHISTVQAGELGQTDRHTYKRMDGRTDGRYQVHYLPRFAVNNKAIHPSICHPLAKSYIPSLPI